MLSKSEVYNTLKYNNLFYEDIKKTSVFINKSGLKLCFIAVNHKYETSEEQAALGRTCVTIAYDLIHRCIVTKSDAQFRTSLLF